MTARLRCFVDFLVERLAPRVQRETAAG
jgi:hypothetical protein